MQTKPNDKQFIFSKKNIVRSTAVLLGLSFFAVSKNPVSANELEETSHTETTETVDLPNENLGVEEETATPEINDDTEPVVEAELEEEAPTLAEETIEEEAGDPLVNLEHAESLEEPVEEDLFEQPVEEVETAEQPINDVDELEEIELEPIELEADPLVVKETEEHFDSEATTENTEILAPETEEVTEEVIIVEEVAEELETSSQPLADDVDIDYDYLLDYAKHNPKDFEKQFGLILGLASQEDLNQVDEGTKFGLVDVLLSENYDEKAISELAKFLFNESKPAEAVDSEASQLAEVDGDTEVTEEDLEELEVTTSSLLDPAVLTGEKAVDFDMIMDNVVGISDSVISLLEERAEGKVSGASIGAVIDSILPTDSLFTNMGDLIQRVSESERKTILQDILFGTEAAGIISEVIPSSVEFNGTPVNYILRKLGSMASDLGSSIAQGIALPLNPGNIYTPGTFRLRGRLFIEATKAARMAHTQWRMKPQVVHSKAGFELSHAFMTVFNPFAEASQLENRLNDVAELVEFGSNYRDITPDDVATTYLKKELDQAIWDVRFKRDRNILGKVPFEVYHNLNKAITEAVGIQLNPETKVKDISGAVANVKAAYDKAANYFNETPFESQRASRDKVKELRDLIWEVRRVRDKQLLGNIAFQDYKALNRSITSAVGTQLRIKKTNGDVDQAISMLKDALATAVSVATI